MYRRIGMAIAGVGALALGACGSSEDSGEFTTAEGEPGEYTIDRETGEARMTVETEDGTATLRSGKDVPLDLPEGFEMFPGATVTSNSVVDQGQRSGSMILYETEAEPQEVVDHFRDQAKALGIDIQMDATMGDSLMIAGEKPGDGLAFQASATRNDQLTTGQLFIGRMPE